MQSHKISCGALVIRDDKILLVRHHRPGVHDFWVAPGGGVEGNEELARAAERETFEETGIKAMATRLAYIDEGWSESQRLLKFWFLADYMDGEIYISANPAEGESIVEANWFALDALPEGHVFPEPLRTRFTRDLASGFPGAVKLPLRELLF
ncbi:ADP-ribose pyrophosphatase YjhB, NUDIX family [Devosia sp. YR412]|uniref:NUDIX domain-containing protein n=1 Tax=Devosia sp. YR412 TaxID=1881030 RepID=UPI0008C3B51B|nr:NUDIX hydrolase [Devosia sp. YR412]SEQ21984.1 ADP-ribose pyrophosphatase YjhB, NUDIX family [Devosia sp. YR412]